MVVSFLLTSFSEIKTSSLVPKTNINCPYLKQRFSILYPDSEIHLTPMTQSSRKIKGLKLYTTVLLTLGLIFLSQDFRTSFYLYSRNLSVILIKKPKTTSVLSLEEKTEKNKILIPLDGGSISTPSPILKPNAKPLDLLAGSGYKNPIKKFFGSASSILSAESSSDKTFQKKRQETLKQVFNKEPTDHRGVKDPRDVITELLDAFNSPPFKPPLVSSGRSEGSSNSKADSSSSLDTSAISLVECSPLKELSTLSSSDLSDLLVFWTTGSLLPFLEHDCYLEQKSTKDGKSISPVEFEELLNLQKPEDNHFLEMGYCFLNKNAFTKTTYGQAVIDTCFNPLKGKYDEKDLEEIKEFQNALIKFSTVQQALTELSAFEKALTELSAVQKQIINKDLIKQVGYHGYCWLQKIKKDPSYPPAELWKKILKKEDEEML